MSLNRNESIRIGPDRTGNGRIVTIAYYIVIVLDSYTNIFISDYEILHYPIRIEWARIGMSRIGFAQIE